MMISLVERKELAGMRKNIIRNVNALEYCWCCQRVSECKPENFDDGPPVWLCGECAVIRATQPREPDLATCWPLTP